ncbi:MULTISPECIES: FAD-dependent oxidoreductase [Streptomyces]|uniref:FAD-dependent oxidoreductase n=3 Tax=Streptomyces halstedii TaxID=1944 RepID=A0ABS6TJ87_STRHA|nr:MULTISPECIES: FAD-dependent oxidoreductase [Streptomyces]AWL38011.1 FAD-binding protein [Streptomyces sp. SM18]MBV7668276.1 FAD-dependent oxidoreductase [Streptomyces halstedii]
MLRADTAHHADVVVIGAGTAGLTAAHQLISAGVDTCVLEAAPRVGGRMATEDMDGFRLDRTGPLLSSAYPELRHTPGLQGLALRDFSPGVLVHSRGRRYRAGDVRSARGVLRAARSRSSAPRAPLGGAIEQARLGAWLSRLATTPVSRILARPDGPALDALSSRGLPPRTVDGFLRPLLSALLSDPVLDTSSRCADLALRSYARGGICVPAGGAAALPGLLAAALPPGTVRTGVHVTAADITSVRTKEHGELSCRSLLLATGAGAAAELLPGLRAPAFHPVTVLHHTAPAPPPTGARLLLDADRSGPVAHTAVMSAVDPSRAPLGRTLITSTVLGPPPPDLDRAVRDHLAVLYGVPTYDWELLAAHHDPEAVPVMAPPHDLRRPVRVLAGLYVCGDHRDTSTVQGALHSGRRAAASILADLGVRPKPAGGESLPAAA